MTKATATKSTTLKKGPSATPKASKKALVSAKKTSTSSHPPYKSMIKKAISTLNEKGGSSKIAITKYIVANYKVNDKAPIQVKLNLKMLVKKEVVHASNKSLGANGSFKLPAKKPKVKKPATTKKSPLKVAAESQKAKSPKVAKSPDKTKSGKKAKSPNKAKAVVNKPTAKKVANNLK